jgi:glycosyltransferase involved in cell wall biosynthesis
MRHLLICPEYPPARGGGIGTYARNIARLLCDHGETVHVIGALWEGAEQPREVVRDGRLTVHRVPYLDWRSRLPRRPHTGQPETARRLHASSYHPAAFAWQAALLAERLIEEEAIDVIEAQEYEAPAYFLQLRRALSAPSGRRPPVLVHLHSPSDLIYRHNDYPVGHPSLVAARFEAYTMRAADALLSPSRFLAGQVAARLDRPVEAIEVIGYPIGSVSPLDRDPATWSARRVCYVGRLEGRKGVLELIDAAVEVARASPGASFDFVGDNVLGNGTLPGRAIVERRIPRDLAPRFRFHGRRAREEVAGFLARASLAVVPSRWDNYPNTCIEAMSSGLPVLATREGGMAELVEDGRSGWLADGADEASLASVLRRAIETPPERLAAMGRAALERVRERCDDAEVLRHQLELRRRLVEEGATLSTRVAFRGPSATSRREPGRDRAGEAATAAVDRQGIAVIVSPAPERDSAGAREATIRSLRAQTAPPVTVVLLGEGWDEQAERGWPAATQVLRAPAPAGLAERYNRGAEIAEGARLRPAGVALLEAGETVAPEFVRRCDEVLTRCAEVGLVSFWTRQEPGDEEYRMRPAPELPHQWLRDDAAPMSVVRAQALRDAGPLRPMLSGSFALWDLSNAVLCAGWAGVTLPELLATHPCREQTEPGYPGSLRLRTLLLERFEHEVSRDAVALVELSTLDPRSRLSDGSMSQRERFDLWVMLVRRSGGLIRWLRRVLTERLSG